MKHAFALAALLAAAAASAHSVAARTPLAQDQYVTDRLVGARIADRIRRECPNIEARMVRAYGQAQALKAYAQRQGHSDAEIDAFLKDEAQRARIFAAADSYMAAHGVRANDAQSYCRLGRAEITAGSFIGSLLSAR